MPIEVSVMPGLRTPAWASAFADASEKHLAAVGYTDEIVSVLLVDDARIRQLNRAWRGKDAPTDVLSWPHNEIADDDFVSPFQFPAESVLGDVAISIETTARQARARRWDEAQEASLLLLHGVLHLLGHEDETEAGARAMQAIEERVLGKPLDVLPTVPEGDATP